VIIIISSSFHYRLLSFFFFPLSPRPPCIRSLLPCPWPT
jgi:hypothetical protein